MKPGEMSGMQDHKKLLRYYATAMYAYTNAPRGSAEEKQAEELSDKFEAELLARLNAGGSPELPKDWPKECQYIDGESESDEGYTTGWNDAVAVCESAVKGASQPLQPRCPKCGALMLGMGSKVCSMVASCSGQEHHNFDMRCWNDFAQFFSAPPAMPAFPCPKCGKELAALPTVHCPACSSINQLTVPASPQLEQVAIDPDGEEGAASPPVAAAAKCTCGSSFGRPLPKGKGLWEVSHAGCDYPDGGCNCYCGMNCELKGVAPLTPRKETEE